MKSFKSILWGLVLIALGVLIGLNQFELIDINIFFKGWWTLFIIIPCFIGLFDKEDRRGNIIGLILGVALLLACRDIISFATVWKLFLPTILVIIGLSFIFKDLFHKKLNDKINQMNKELNEDNNVFCAFSGQDIHVEKEFKGTSINAIFGGVDLDLTDAKIKEDAIINTTAIFGGIDIKVPNDVNIEIKSNSLFGGVSDARKDIEATDKSKTIYINALCLFGGVEIKCKAIKK